MLRGVRVPTVRVPTAVEVVNMATAVIEGMRGELAQNHVVVGIGLAVPGPVRASDGVVTLAPHLDWHDEPIGTMLQQTTGFPVLAANDASQTPPLAEREGWGAVSSRKLFEAIDRRRVIALDRLIYALGIRQVGEATARLLARHYRTFEEWRNAMEDAAADEESEAYRELTNIGQIGPSVAGDIIAFFKEPHNVAALDDLRSELREVTHPVTIHGLLS